MALVHLLEGFSLHGVLVVMLVLSTVGSTYINQFAVHIKGGHHVANRVAKETGLRNLGQIGSLEDHYLFEASHRGRRSATPSHDHVNALNSHPHVHWSEQQFAKSRTKRDFHPRDVAEQMSVIDPYWSNQWYLHGGAEGGYDMNVQEAWREGYTGKNIVVTILDDGLERDHPDLVRNYDPYASYDVNSHDNDPMPRYDFSNENRHGTRCAGEVSAEANNTACTIGIAPDSKIGGIRMLDGEVYDAVEAASLSFNRSHVDIYSASWGPDDDGRVVDGPGKLAKKAFINGIHEGRGGKGSIFVWASGNGGSSQDSCNCDGYANSIYTLSISSTSENGVKPWYLEECSSTLASTYSSGAYNERQIASTDLRKRCTTTHTGTSASAPLAAGIVALILEANNNLTWRDVQYITLMTARPEPMRDGQWVVNGVGRKVSLRYGYGLMDATSMVKLALVWTTVPKKVECGMSLGPLNAKLEGHEKYTTQIESNGCQDTAQEINYLEHVQAHVTLNYHKRGDLVLYLTSPAGTRSQILAHRPSDNQPGGFDDWPFLSVHFWGENPRGQWTLEVQDANVFSLGGGTLVQWYLVFHGTKDQPVRLRNATGQPTVKPTTKPTAVPTEKPTVSITCHSECKDTCTGPTAKDCHTCKHLRIGATSECVFACPSDTYVQDGTCLACEMSCATCRGPTLTHCLSCPPGHQYIRLKDDQSVCSVECLDGFYQSTNSCIACEPKCKTCENSPADCTSCHKSHALQGNVCVMQPASEILSQTPGLLVVLALVIFVVLLVAVFMAVVYLRKNSYLCWSENVLYSKVQDEDFESLMYSDNYGP